jgi:hypothetical protein
MNRTLSRLALACAVPLLGYVATVTAATMKHGCTHCGCSCECRKVCRLVCEDKKVDVICWGCICEDFCLAKHDKVRCVHCETVCAKCNEPHDPKAPCVLPKRFVWKEWIPGCATMHTRKKLMKKTEQVTVKTFKWVVEDLCPQCESQCDVAKVGPDDDVPPPPMVADAKLLYSTGQAVK